MTPARLPRQAFGTSDSRWAIALSAVVVMVVVGIAASLYLDHERDQLLDRAGEELNAVARLTGDQLVAWYDDELHDILLLATNETVQDLATRFRNGGRDRDRRALARYLDGLSLQHGYLDLFVCDESGRRGHLDSDSTTACNPVLREAIARFPHDVTARSTDIYNYPNPTEQRIDFLSSVSPGEEENRLVLVGRFDAADVVYALTGHWPTPSRSAELYLARQERDSVRVLSPLRGAPDAALVQVYSLKDTNAAVVKAALGRRGIVTARDYRGVDVLASVRSLPGTPWLLVAKIDREEVLESLYSELVLLSALVLACLLAVTAGVSVLFSRRQGAMYRAMFEEHASVKMLIDPSTGRIVDANHAAAEFYGWTREQLRERHIWEINTLPREQVIAAMASTVRERRQHREFRHRRADGSVRDVDVFAGALRSRGTDLIYSIIHDVTGKKEAERSIRLLGRSVEQSPVTIVITDPEGKIEYVNPEFTRVTGYAADEVLGSKTNVLGSGQHTRDFYAGLWSTVLAGGEWIGEFHNRKKNGELFWERAIISPVLSEDGAITHLIGIKTDITEEKRLLSELVEAKEKAEESDRLKSAFLANMSHEIRTPINSVVGFAELLADPTISDEDRKEFADVVRQRSYDLLNIINDILDISRIEAGVVKIVEEECSVREILQDLHMMFSRPRGNGHLEIILRNDLPPAEDMIVTDAARVRQVLTNLLSNAIKFTHEGGITFGCRREGDNELLFFVEDTGVGIPEDVRAIIFDRFRQADEGSSRRYGGTGLGLAICHGIVHLLGGHIWVEERPGGGSSFRFTIPIKKD